MLNHSALIGFVAVSDLDRARQFYGDTLGLPITEEVRSRSSRTPTARCCG